MKKLAKLCFVVLFSIVGFSLFAGERTIPVDVFLMIDKSLSMQDPGKFDSLQKWVLDELVSQMLIPGDWVTIYQFYEKPEHILTTTIDNNNSLQKVYNAVKAIKPDGHYTDIGYALDTVQQTLDARGFNGRFKVLLLLTDLVHDAPWTSKYRGKQNSFESPYLVEARSIKHDNWYEITLDMDIQDAVVQRTQSLYSDVVANEGLPRTDASQDKELIQGETRVINSDGSSTTGGAGTGNTGSSGSGTSGGTSSSSTTSASSGLVAGNTTGTGGFGTSGGSQGGVSGTGTGGSATSGSAGDSSSSNASGTGSNAVSTSSGITSNNATNSSREWSGNSFFDQYGIPILIGLGILVLLIILILVIRHIQNEKKRKEEAKKEKIALV